MTRPYTLELRTAFTIGRYHTMGPDYTQSIAEHVANMLALAYHVFPAPSPELVEAVLYHDVAEVRTGDMPYPTKQAYPQLRTLLDRVEAAEAVHMGVACPLYGVDYWRLKALDMLECLWYGIDLVQRGRLRGRGIIRAAVPALAHILTTTCLEEGPDHADLQALATHLLVYARPVLLDLGQDLAPVPGPLWERLRPQPACALADVPATFDPYA